MLTPIIALIIGFVVLVFSADRFVEGAASIAKHFHVPPLVIGMVIVGFGTSAPEMLVSALASIDGSSGIALGNAYGSNISNIALILGVTALIMPITVEKAVLKKELPVLLLLTVIAATELYDGYFSRLDAVILFTPFFVFMFRAVQKGLQNKKNNKKEDNNKEIKDINFSSLKAYGNLLGGLIFLLGSSKLLVWGATEIAHILGVSDLVIGLTVVAIGTSLPELASSVIAALKKENDIALGNIIGSNMFNTALVAGIAGIINPSEIPKGIFPRDIGFMTALTLSLFILGYSRKGNGKIGKIGGTILFTAYISYTAYIAVSAFKQ